MDKIADKLVIIKPGALGDTLLLAPALRALREGRPALDITVVGSMPAVKLLHLFGLADAVGDIEKVNLFVPSKAEYEQLNKAAVIAFMPLGKEDRQSLKTVAGARSVASHPSHNRQAGQHMAVYLHACLCACFPHGRALSREALASPQLKSARLVEPPYGVLAPGAGCAAKRAPLKVFEAHARDLAAKGVSPVFVAGEVEIQTGVAARFPEPYARIEMPLLEDLASLMKDAVAVFANDSGPAHLAGLLGAPTTVFFGPTDPAVWRPWGPRVHVEPF
ncbi:MAG: glycosyltransferase family 9 protein [Desulfobacterales bacterium]|nr:glycosyltransferase family 9 protein [Desulfobacterales bacterium]